MSGLAPALQDAPETVSKDVLRHDFTVHYRLFAWIFTFAFYGTTIIGGILTYTITQYTEENDMVKPPTLAA